MMMKRMSTPAPAPMPTFIARLGPLSGESVEAGIGGATGRFKDVDVEEDGDAKLVVRFELRGDAKGVAVRVSDGRSVIELTTVVSCCELVLSATVVDASEDEDMDDDQSKWMKDGHKR
jgi:hypothetical protein